jgi:hypothetical protein
MKRKRLDDRRGEILNTPGARIVCLYCDGNIIVDRYYNGARGIFLRALRDSAFSLTL